jgi:hypothetical protein
MKRTKETYINARLDDMNAKLSNLLHIVESQSYAIDYLINKICVYSNTDSPKSMPSPKKYNRKHSHSLHKKIRTSPQKSTKSRYGYMQGINNPIESWSSSSDSDITPTSTNAYKAEMSFASPNFPQTQVNSVILPPVHTSNRHHTSNFSPRAYK